MKKLILAITVFALFGLKNRPNEPRVYPKNVVLMIGDGMGLAQVSAALYAQGNALSLEEFPVIGLQKTYSANELITDSAAAATSMACGIKTRNNAIALDPEGKPCKTILEEAEENGLATGLIATTSIVHATPGAFIGHQTYRNFYENIALDFLKTDIDLFIGGGKQFFDRRNNDNRNLIQELRQKGYSITDYSNTDIWQLKPNLVKNMGHFTADNQPLPASLGRDYLPYASKLAVEYLHHRNPKGFFMMIEGSQIDLAGHANQSGFLLSEMEDFDKAIIEVLNFAKLNGETLVIVTADHETGGLAINEGSKMKNLQLKYNTNGHTATMVPVFAYGPQAELFRGIYENTEIYFKMKKALRLK